MVNLILASHGEFAKGIAQSGQMIFGQQENFVPVVLTPDNGPDDLKSKIEEALKSFDNDDETLFIVDLWGGTPFNVSSKIVAENEDKLALISGMNLPMVIEALGMRMSETSAAKIATAIRKPAMEGIRLFPESLQKNNASANEPKKSSPRKGKEGDGLDIGLVRIDSRLLHGQVATAWTKAVSPERIIIVSDKVSKDELRKTLLTKAAPTGVKVNVIPVSKLAQIYKDPRFDGVRVMLLFENPADVVEAEDQGVKLKDINIGSMSFAEGKKMITSAIAVDQKDIDDFKKLRDDGVEFNIRKVPNDKSENVWKLLEEKKILK